MSALIPSNRYSRYSLALGNCREGQCVRFEPRRHGDLFPFVVVPA